MGETQGALPLDPSRALPCRVFDPLDTHLAIELVTFSCYARVFIHRIPTLSPVSTSYGKDQ